MLSRTTLSYCPPDDSPNSRRFNLLQPLCPLFSSAVLYFQSLAASFAKKWGVGYTPATHPFEISNIQTLLFQPVCNLVNAIVARPSFVFITLRIAFPAKPFFSQPSGLPGGVGRESAFMLCTYLKSASKALPKWAQQSGWIPNVS